jgi:hypothetical protein
LLSSCSPCAPSLNVFVLILTQVTLSYVCSRIYLHYPPGDDTDAFMSHPEIPAEALRKEKELAEAEPDVNPWACIILLVITVALMGVTATFVRLTRLSLLAHDVIPSLPAACRQHKICPKRITDQRGVRALSPRSHIFASVLTISPIHSRIIGGSASSSSHSCPSLPMAPSPECSSSVAPCGASSQRHSLQISSLRRARST